MINIRSRKREKDEQLALREEKAILRATEMITQAMEAANVGKSELARRLGVSASEITQRLDGTRNLTIRSFVGMLDALEYDLEFRARDRTGERIIERPSSSATRASDGAQWKEPHETPFRRTLLIEFKDAHAASPGYLWDSPLTSKLVRKSPIDDWIRETSSQLADTEDDEWSDPQDWLASLRE